MECESVTSVQTNICCLVNTHLNTPTMQAKPKKSGTRVMKMSLEFSETSDD